MDYSQLETNIKKINIFINELPLAELVFPYLRGLIGFCSRREKSNFFSQHHKLPKISKGILLKNSKILFENQLNRVHNIISQKRFKKILIFRSPITEPLIKTLSPSTYIIHKKNNYLFAPFYPQRLSLTDKQLSTDFVNKLCNVFCEFSLKISMDDQQALSDLIQNLIYEIKACNNFFKMNHHLISCLVTHADNHMPFILYVLKAKQYQILTLMIQHGLDCEPFFLDEAYADYIAVWGEKRKERYIKSSAYQPKEIRVTGNPLFDEFSKQSYQATASIDSKQILFLGRPHSIEKSFFHFRSPDEGINIISSLLEYCQANPHIIVQFKPHPVEDLELLTAALPIKEVKNFSITQEKPLPLIQDTDLVLVEDSTAALEAMLLNKPIVHVHFNPSKPVLPIKSYNAGALATNKNTLFTALDCFVSRPSGNAFIKGQRSFIRDFAYCTDGNSTGRVVKFLKDILKSVNSPPTGD